MPRKERHVVPNPDGGWDSKREKAQKNRNLRYCGQPNPFPFGK